MGWKNLTLAKNAGDFYIFLWRRCRYGASCLKIFKFRILWRNFDPDVINAYGK